ncbi:MAG: Rrf2 family transcriptional regulator [Treponema sp.]|nr:Rrf2 family transcriptional regulator [Treponema sp.]
MKISTRGRYALRFMIDLAQHGTDSYVPLRDVSERQAISIKYLEQITALLSKYGLLQSVRGPQGGYRLAKPVAEYTVREILRTTEGNLAPVACLESDQNNCERKETCSTLKVWLGLGKVINDYLDSITLDQLMFDCGTNNYVI